MTVTAASPLPLDLAELLDLDEVAALGYGNPYTLRIRIREGEIPAYHVGKRWKIHPADLPLLLRPAAPEHADVAWDALESAALKAASTIELSESQRDRIVSLLGLYGVRRDVVEVLDLSQVEALGYGYRNALRKRVLAGRIPGYWCRGKVKIRRDDLHLLVAPVAPAPAESAWRDLELAAAIAAATFEPTGPQRERIAEVLDLSSP